jgi:Na+/melibiose symporter-like transporter
MEYLQLAADFLETFACRVSTGAAVYITLVEHAARMACGVEIAATECSPSYRRATVMQASLVIAGCVFAAVAWLTGGTAW